MVGKTPRARKDEQQRMGDIVEYCGCLCSLLMGTLNVQATIEHVTDRGRRVGKGSDQHKNTIGLSRWHHFGEHWPGRNKEQMIEFVGPSLAHGRKPFEEHFGDELILVKVQDYMLDLFALQPWESYNCPSDVAELTREKWIELNASKNEHSLSTDP